MYSKYSYINMKTTKPNYRKILVLTFLIVFLLLTIWFIMLDENRLQSMHGNIFGYETKSLKEALQCQDQRLRTQFQQYGDYWLMKNLIRGRLSKSMGCAESITYTTNGDFTFLGQVEMVVKRWLGPISLAIFAPGYDFNSTMNSIQYIRNCLPESQLIRDYVTFHIYFPNEHMPQQRIPQTEAEAWAWPYVCNVSHAPYENVQHSEMYKTQANLTYPINVGRNIARKSANTYFIFACDIELYPSLGFIETFLQMAFKNVSSVLSKDHLRVFPMPIFELQNSAPLPESKTELVEMLESKMAIPFHQYRCRSCHEVPEQKNWLLAEDATQLKVFTVAKRHHSFKGWEPFYISTNQEPDFDERVTWEGQSDKRIQNYAMCLLDYEYHILYPAFLVHSPGIKKGETNNARLHYVGPMNSFISNVIVPEYQILYGENKECSVR